MFKTTNITLQELDFIFLSNFKKYDHTDKSHFEYEPSRIPFGYYVRVTTEVTKSDRNNYEEVILV